MSEVLSLEVFVYLGLQRSVEIFGKHLSYLFFAQECAKGLHGLGDFAFTLDDLPVNLGGGRPGAILLGKEHGVVLVALERRV